jgi:hypothetical protein
MKPNENEKKYRTMGPKTPVPRILTPILHKTTLHRSHVSNVNPPHYSLKEQDDAFLIQLLISEIPIVSTYNDNDTSNKMNLDDKNGSKSVSINAELNYITFNFDPTSTCIPTITELLTPCTPRQIITHKINEIQKIKNKISTLTRKPNKSHNSEIKKPANNQFLIIKLNVQIKQCLLDYIAPIVQSHSLISISLITISSTIVNNSKIFSMKFNMKNLAVHLSNRIFRNPIIEQNPLNINGIRRMHDTAKTNENNINTNNDIYEKHYMDASVYKSSKTNLIENSLLNQYKSMDKKKNSVLDLDRYLDIHCLVQLLTVDHVEAKLSLNLDEMNNDTKANGDTDNDNSDNTTKICRRSYSDLKSSKDDLLYPSEFGTRPECEGSGPTIFGPIVSGPIVSKPIVTGPTTSGPGLAGINMIERWCLCMRIYGIINSRLCYHEHYFYGC